MTDNERIDAYKAAYLAANGKEVTVVREAGRFVVGPPGHPVRWTRPKIESCTAVLTARAKSGVSA